MGSSVIWYIKISCVEIAMLPQTLGTIMKHNPRTKKVEAVFCLTKMVGSLEPPYPRRLFNMRQDGKIFDNDIRFCQGFFLKSRRSWNIIIQRCFHQGMLIISRLWEIIVLIWRLTRSHTMYPNKFGYFHDMSIYSIKGYPLATTQYRS